MPDVVQQNDEGTRRRLPAVALKLRALAGGRGVWALGDQATLSLGNFLTNILLIRTLTRDDFGDYAVLFSVLLFLNNLHTSLVTYPLSLTIAGSDDHSSRRRTRGSLAITCLLSAPFALILSFAAVLLGRASAIPWLVAALVFWQLQETLRRAMMARLQHHRAMPGDAISYLGQAAGVWLLGRFGVLTPTYAFAVVASTSALALLVQVIQLKVFGADDASRSTGLGQAQSSHVSSAPGTVRHGSGVRAAFQSQSHEHWTLGRWVLLSNLVGLITVYATPWILRYYHGAGEIAAYQAVANLLNVSNPIFAGIAGLIVPAVAKARAEGGLIAARSAAVKYAVQGAALLMPYFLILAIVPHFALQHFYRAGSPYLAYTTPLRLFVGVYSLYYVSQMISGFLNGLGESRWTFYAQAAAAAANGMFCLPLAAMFGFVGVAWGGIAPMLAQLVVCAYFARSLFKPQTSPAASAPMAAMLERMPEGT